MLSDLFCTQMELLQTPQLTQLIVLSHDYMMIINRDWYTYITDISLNFASTLSFIMADMAIEALVTCCTVLTHSVNLVAHTVLFPSCKNFTAVLVALLLHLARLSWELHCQLIGLKRSCLKFLFAPPCCRVAFILHTIYSVYKNDLLVSITAWPQMAVHRVTFG